jgi:hypothetical protein
LDDNYCRNPSESKDTAWCPTGPPDYWEYCDVLEENAYSFEATHTHTGLFLSDTKPADDFTNSNPSICAVTYSIVDSDGNALDADTAAAVTINAAGFV